MCQTQDVQLSLPHPLSFLSICYQTWGMVAPLILGMAQWGTVRVGALRGTDFWVDKPSP